MKKRWGIMAGAMLAGIAGTTRASSLEDRGWYDTSGNYSATALAGYAHMVYEQDKNLTWLDEDSGSLNWNAAKDWVELGTWGGHNDWRLTSVTDVDDDGFTGDLFHGEDWAYNLNTANGEMAHLWYDELGNLAAYDTSGTFRGGASDVDWGLVNTGPFQNLQSAVYWSGTEYAPDTDVAWVFNTHNGFQFVSYKDDQTLALAVRTGDIAATSAVPLPGAVWLFASALLGLTGAARRRSVLG